MSRAPIRLETLGLVAVLITGCGGSGGGTTTCTGADCGGGTGPPPTTVTLTFPGGVTLAAAQIGSSAFTVQTLSANTLSLSIPSGTSNYAVAYLCPAQSTGQGETTEEAVWEASTADGTSENLTCAYNSVSTAGTGALSGSLDATAIQGVTGFELYTQNGSSVMQEGVEGGATATFSNLLAQDGNDRILVLAEGSQGVLAAKNFTNQTVPGALNGGNTVVFGAGDETTTAAISYNSVPAGFGSPSTYVTLQMTGDTGLPAVLASQATTQYPVLPAAALESGDLYGFNAGAASSTSTSGVYAGATNAGGTESLTFPAPWTYAGPTPSAQPTFTFDYTGISGKTDAYQEAMYSWPVGSSVSSSSNTDEIEVTATLNYQAGSTTLAAPDLSGVTGFLSAPPTGTQVSWFAEVWQSSYGFNWPPASSSTSSSVANSGSFTAP